ncbi:MAG: sugar transferase [Lutibacter sp.]|nr:sugar transferase [Lutibacter sp.]MDP3946437.1 sugar transferase [Lutibacter sp.]
MQTSTRESLQRPRDELSLEDKVAYEKEYLDRKSFLFDLKILVLTFTRVLGSKGVTH